MSAYAEAVWVPRLLECRMSVELGARLKCEEGQEYVLRAGTASLPIRLTLDGTLAPGRLEIPKEGLAKLSLPGGLSANIVASGRELRLGPVVGVFVNPATVRRLIRGKGSFRSTELVKANRNARCILFFFSAPGVAGSAQRLAGCYYDYERDRWRKAIFPWPDVLYDRGGGFPRGQRLAARRLRRRLAETPGLRLFNAQHYFDKWDQHVRLSRSPLVAPHIPETVRYRQKDDLAEMLRRHRRIYVKSVLGSNGREVMRVAANYGRYYYSYVTDKTVSGVCRDLAALEQVLSEVFGSKRLILQRAIDVLECSGSPVDLRALVIKNSLGNWQLIGLPVRVGRCGSPVTSTRSGSTIRRLDDFGQLFGLDGSRLEELKREIIRVVWLTTYAIEQEYGSFGELGIDLAVDKEGRVWVLEANAKPGKDTVWLSGDQEALTRAFLMPLEYCKYLAGFTSEDAEATAVRIGQPPVRRIRRTTIRV